MEKIKTKHEYSVALQMAQELIDIDPEVGTKEANELDYLCLLIKEYEDIHYPMDSI